jgi:hypothetical protein
VSGLKTKVLKTTTNISSGLGRFLYIGLKAKNNEFIGLWPTWWEKYGRTLLVRIKQFIPYISYPSSEILLIQELLKFSAFGANAIFTDEPENVRYILSEGAMAGKVGIGNEFHEQWVQFLGPSVFNLDGVCI